MTGSASAAGGALSAADVAHLRHELRTPVNQIVGYCEMLLEDLDDAGASEHAGRRSHLTSVLEAVTEVRGLIDRGLSSAATLTFAEADALRATLLGPCDRICTAMDELLASEGDEAVITDARRIRDAARRLTTTDASANATDTVPASSAVAAVSERPPATKRAARILVVDDIEENRVVLGRRLARDGHSVVAAANGLEALERAAAERFDVILLDVMMPELDGYETLIRLKSGEQTRDVPVIMISALDDIASIARCIERGADDYLPKPFDPVLLRARINASLEKNAARERERDFLRDVGLVAGAATAVTRGTYLAGGLGPVARRPDELGTLARVFDGMAAGIQQREARLRDQIGRLREAIVGVSDAPVEMASSSGELLRPGDVLADRYTIEQLIGAGGMGMVYVASDLELGDRVALKTLRPELTTVDDTAVERFRNEIRLARRIAHRNIVRTHDFGKTNDIYFVTMELVSGTTLRAVLDQRGRLSVPAVLAIARQLAQALACAHEQGIIHRDIKPQNLLLDAEGTLKVMDFGVARLAQRASGLTQVGMVVGTPAYMAPEQLLDEDADVRSDLYAAGVVLYECLTGRRPYDARSPVALIGKILQGGAAPPSDVASDIAPSMDALVLELLARDRDERTSSARALGDALDLIG